MYNHKIWKEVLKLIFYSQGYIFFTLRMFERSFRNALIARVTESINILTCKRQRDEQNL